MTLVMSFISIRPVAGHEQGLLGTGDQGWPVQPAFSADMDAYTNVESLHFKFNQQQNKIPTVFIYNVETKVIFRSRCPRYRPSARGRSAAAYAPGVPKSVTGMKKPRCGRERLSSSPCMMRFLPRA